MSKAVSRHTATGRDAHVVSLAERAIETMARSERLLDPYMEVVGLPARVDVAAIQARLAYEAAQEELAAVRATTREGMRAKARVLLTWLAPGGLDDPPLGDPDEMLAWSLCRDLVGEAA